jgi:two-component system OmpR family response regulator
MTMAHSSSQSTGPSILIVDDDRNIRELLSRSLSNHGYDVITACSAKEMEQTLGAQQIDLVLLDIMMPGEDGLSACRRMARADGPPIIFLSALGDEDDRISGLETGASHYLPKPCAPREILATVRAALRHHAGRASFAERKALLFDRWRIDFTSHELFDPDGVLVHLTDGEFAVLRVFVERPRRVLTRDALLEAARGPDTPSFDRAIDVQVSRLRRKLRDPEGELIRTIRNEGYIFTAQVTRV